MTSRTHFDEIDYQPLRVPGGWKIIWNTLYAKDLTDPSLDKLAYLNSSSIINASHAVKRLILDVSWFPKDCVPGNFLLKMFYSNPVSQNGLIDLTMPLDWDHEVISFETSDRLLLVNKIEALFHHNEQWVTHLDATDCLVEANSNNQTPVCHQNHSAQTPSLTPELQPLCITHGWEITCNYLYAPEALEYFLANQTNATLFSAIKQSQRLKLVVTYLKHNAEKTYQITVLYAPWPRTPKGKRIKTAPLSFDEKVENLLVFQTINYQKLIIQLNTVFKENNWKIEYN